LKKIRGLASALASSLSELDVISRDDLERRSKPKEIEALIGSLGFLCKEMSELEKHTQGNGTPRDLAEERWIVEVADIYENAFGQPAGANRVAFCRLLELSRPSSLPRYGKLNPRQIKRALERRKGSSAVPEYRKPRVRTSTPVATGRISLADFIIPPHPPSKGL
jgi:hypothetical protein